MKEQREGWVIIRLFPEGDSEPMIFHDYFHWNRSKAIRMVESGSEYSWRHWYRKFDMRCVKATRTVEVINAQSLFVKTETYSI